MKKCVTFFVLFGLVSFAFGANVTFKVNMSTFPGATDSTHAIHVRGNFNGWGDANPLTCDGGDYWSATIPLDAGTYVYKFTCTENVSGTVKWEDNISDREVTVSDVDMVLDLAYFDQLEPPYTPTDSVDVWFRVNMAGVLDYDGTSPVGVRGGIPLDPTWETAAELLQEGDSDYYSGLISFPNSSIEDTIEYKFVWGPLSGWDGVHWESPKYDILNGNRYFVVSNDTTLAFKYFNDEPPAMEIDTFDVTFVLNSCMLDNFTDSTVTAFVTGSYDGWDHYNDILTTVGDYSSITIEMIGSSSGIDLAYKYLYQVIGVGEDIWESVPDRVVTVNSDTTFFSYWDNIAPFTPTDSVDVWFRVNMAGVPDYDSTSPVGVRGGIPLDPTWGTTYVLDQEDDSDYYSGLISFPNSAIGDTIQYKFVWGTETIHWESPKYDILNGNRYFVVSNDTTLAFKYFSDEPPTGVEPQTAQVLFQVDMAGYIELGIFSEARKDSMQVRGGFNGWSETPTNCRMEKVPGTSWYSMIATITNFPGTEIEYKFYIKFSQESLDYWEAQGITDIHPDWGYEDPPTRGGGNRIFTFEGDPTSIQILDLAYYNGLPLEGIIPEGQTVAVTFNVDMNDVDLFTPTTDTVYYNWKDEWQMNALGYADSTFKYSDPDGDGVYTITIDFKGPVAYTLTYATSFEGPDISLEEGGGFAYGRFRCRYIQPTSVDPVIWPTAYTCPTDTFTIDPPLVVETPPFGTAIDLVDDIVPSQFVLEQNYPNPFNPITTISFAIPVTENVSLTIYNMLGQAVNSVTYKHLKSGSYNFTWDATDFAGNRVSSGIYFYQLKVGDKFTDTKKMLLLK